MAVTESHKLSHLKTTQIYYLMVLDGRSPKWVFPVEIRGSFFLEVLGERTFLSPFQQLGASGRPLLLALLGSNLRFHSHPLPASHSPLSLLQGPS